MARGKHKLEKEDKQHLSLYVRKGTFRHVRQAKIQINLLIRTNYNNPIFQKCILIKVQYMYNEAYVSMIFMHLDF